MDLSVKFCQCNMVLADPVVLHENFVCLRRRLLIMANVAGPLCGKWILGSFLQTSDHLGIFHLM